MSSPSQVEAPNPRDLDDLETLLDLVFSGSGAQPDAGPASAEPYPASDSGAEAEAVTVLKSKLDFTSQELTDTKRRLQAANFRLGYLEALLQARELELENNSQRHWRGLWWSKLRALWGASRAE